MFSFVYFYFRDPDPYVIQVELNVDQRGNLSKINVYVTYMSRIRHVYVTSPLAKVAFTYTSVDAYRIFQNLQALTLETESFKSLNVDVTYAFTKAYLRVLLVYACGGGKHKQK